MTTIPRLAACALTLAACACAGLPNNVREYYTANAAQLAQQEVPLLVDSCVLRDEIGADYVLRQATLDNARATATSMQAYLRDRGLRTGASLTPFLCGTPWWDSEHQPVEIAETKGEPRQSIIFLPIPSGERLSGVPLFATAYRNLLADLVTPAAGNEPETGTRALTLRPDEANVLVRELGAHRAWVLQLGGTQVSASKSIGIGMITGVATVMLFGVGVASMPVDGYRYNLSLVDLDANRVIWEHRVNTVSGDPAKARVFDGKWAQAAFTPFLDPEVQIAATVAPAAAAPLPSPAFTAATAMSPASPQQQVELRERPRNDARILLRISLAELHQVSSMHNAEGDWCYLQGTQARGWAPQADCNVH